MVSGVAPLLCALAACTSSSSEPPVATPSVVMGTSAARGRAIDVRHRFAVSPTAPAFKESYTVFVHAVDSQGNRVWTSDHLPPEPTTTWKPGSVIEYTRRMAIPRNAPLGSVTLQVGLYSPTSGTRLTLAGTDGGRHAYRVGSLEVLREQPSPSDAFFLDGWWNVEAPEDAQGLEWHWSKRTATLSIRNPRADAVLVIDADQPIKTGSGAVQVEVHAGATRIGSFTVASGERRAHRLNVTAAQLGQANVVRFTLSVDRTFTPARLPGSSSSDSRELGVRVFSVSVEPAAAAIPQP
jgi:hypothetical protein